jgi:hypothetical protein
MIPEQGRTPDMRKGSGIYSYVLYMFGALVLLMAGLLAACSGIPPSVRQVFPLHQTNTSYRTNWTATNICSGTRDSIFLKLGYIDRVQLMKMSIRYKTSSQSDGPVKPLVTVFHFSLSNGRKDRIRVNTLDSYILDSGGRQYSALDYETYRDAFPVTFEQSSVYNFLYDRGLTETTNSKESKKPAASGRTPLFVEGLVRQQSNVSGFIVFPFISELSPTLSVVLSGIRHLDDKDKPSGKTDFRFDFIQSLRRMEEP